MEEIDEWAAGYCDGRNPDCPEPGPNRGARYVHSFRVGRSELTDKPIPAALSRARAASIDAMLSDATPEGERG